MPELKQLNRRRKSIPLVSELVRHVCHMDIDVSRTDKTVFSFAMMSSESRSFSEIRNLPVNVQSEKRHINLECFERTGT